MKPTNDQIVITNVDVPDMPEIFADNVRTMTFHDGVFRGELIVNRFDQAQPSVPQTARSYPVARLVLTPTCAANLQVQLTTIMGELEKHGLLQRNPLVPPPMTPAPKH
jgi:hypothetical protein